MAATIVAATEAADGTVTAWLEVPDGQGGTDCYVLRASKYRDDGSARTKAELVAALKADYTAQKAVRRPAAPAPRSDLVGDVPGT